MADLTHKRSKKSRAKKSRAILISVYKKVMDYGKCLDCGECNTSYNWCQTCNSKHFIICFTKWSSGNRDIDKFIRNIQINASSRNRVLEWIPYDRLTDFKMIGKGGFGNVQKATWTEGQIDLRIGWNYLLQRWERHGATQVAVKILDNSRNITAEFFKEMMPSLRTRPAIPSHVKNHLNRILGISKNPTTQKYVIIMQFANNGNLRNYLKKNYSTITWDRKLLILQYIAGGLKSLHALGLIHKNLHSNNILLHEEIPFIGDLGLCRPVDKFDAKEEIYGVLPYVSPEVLRTKVYTKESDIYSFAFIMWEMCTYLPPLYDRSHDTNLALEIFHGLRPNILEGTPRTFARFMKLCWDANPSKRPTAEEVYNTLKYWHMEFSQKGPTECYSDFKAADDWKLLNNPNIPYPYHHPNAHYTSRPLQLPEVINDFTSNQNTHLENFARDSFQIDKYTGLPFKCP